METWGALKIKSASLSACLAPGGRGRPAGCERPLHSAGRGRPAGCQRPPAPAAPPPPTVSGAAGSGQCGADSARTCYRF